MPTMKVAKRDVERLAAPDPSGKQTLYWAEGDYRGLGILVSGVTKTKSWVCQAKLKNGLTRRITIGPTNVFTVEQAWEEAKIKLAEIYRGNDPKATATRRARSEMTVQAVLDDYLPASSNLASKTQKLYRATARNHLSPFLNRLLREIAADEIEDHFRIIAQSIQARRAAGEIRGGVGVDGRATANAALRLFRALWNHQAERDNDFPPNPIGRRFKRQWHQLDRRTRRVPPDRLTEFYTATRRLRSDIQRDLVVLGLFTGMREQEAAGLRWDEVDLPQRMMRLPATRMKANRALNLPMSDVVHGLLVLRRAIGRDGPYVFPGNGKSGHCESFTYALRQITEMTGIVTSPHDLRRTYASVAATAEIPPAALKSLIAHSVGADITFGYTILSETDLRRAAQKVADHMKQLCGFAEPIGENVATLG